jgi:hypothetical protein
MGKKERKVQHSAIQEIHHEESLHLESKSDSLAALHHMLHKVSWPNSAQTHGFNLR